MRNKKSLLSLGLLALILVLGVGYAVVSGQNLTISGTATTAEETMAVYFQEAKDAENFSEGVTAKGEVTGTKPLTASITVSGLDAVGDYAEVVYVVANDEIDLAASLAKSSITVLSDAVDGEPTDLAEYYNVTTSVDTTATTVPNGNGTNPGTAEVTVRVELSKLPITSTESKANITVVLAATPVQK